MPKLKEKEKKKYSGGPKRRRYLNRIAKNGSGDGRGDYDKYGDVDPDLVHHGDATYRGVVRTDTEDIAQYSVNVYRGHGKIYFIHKGTSGSKEALYKSANGANPVAVTI